MKRIEKKTFWVGFKPGRMITLKNHSDLKELVARVDAVLRRGGLTECRGSTSNCGIGHLWLDYEKREITVDGQAVHLTTREWELLCLLAHNQGRVITSQQLLWKVWGPEYVDESHYLKTFIYRLRKKIEKIRPILHVF